MTAPHVAILAEDLIWQTRLAEAVRSIGATLDRTRSAPELERALDRADGLIVDLTARSYDGVWTIEMARRLRPALPILAVGQHEDLGLRKRALAAGADRVLAYRKLFEDGPATLERWLAGAAAGAPAER